MPFPLRVFLLSAISAVLCSGAVLAKPALEWDRTTARIELKPGEEEARAGFKVTNNGEDTVRIARVKTSCGCTGSILNRRILRPGESTEIVGTFHKGRRKGVNRNKLTVFLDGRKEAVATLRMVVEIPTLVDATPRIVHWNERTKKTPRTVRVRLDGRYVDAVSEIRYDRSKLSVSRKKPSPEDDAHLLLEIRPNSYEEDLRETIDILATGGDGMRGEASVYVFSRP